MSADFLRTFLALAIPSGLQRGCVSNKSRPSGLQVKRAQVNWASSLLRMASFPASPQPFALSGTPRQVSIDTGCWEALVGVGGVPWQRLLGSSAAAPSGGLLLASSLRGASCIQSGVMGGQGDKAAVVGLRMQL